MSWDAFAESVTEAQKLAQPDDFDFLRHIGESYATLHLVPPAKFASLKQASELPLAVATDCDQYLHERLTLLETQLATVNRTSYNGFNLLLGDGERLVAFSNVTNERHELAPGIYGLSNALLDTPWPKVGAGKTALEAAIAALPGETALWKLLCDDTTHPDSTLPATGVPLEWERLLSAAFVSSPDYGTRSSTVLTVSAGGVVNYDEQTWLPGGTAGERRRYRFHA